MILDGLSALVYALTFNVRSFKAVIKAHKEYRRLKSDISTEQIIEYLTTKSGNAEVIGIYKKWIIFSSMIKGNKITGAIEGKEFFKF